MNILPLADSAKMEIKAYLTRIPQLKSERGANLE
jgi:hypothetical protein